LLAPQYAASHCISEGCVDSLLGVYPDFEVLLRALAWAPEVSSFSTELPALEAAGSDFGSDHSVGPLLFVLLLVGAKLR
jgi:hypothetical protein